RLVADETAEEVPAVGDRQALAGRREIETHEGRWVLRCETREVGERAGGKLSILAKKLHGPGAQVFALVAEERNEVGVADSADEMQSPERPEFSWHLRVRVEDLPQRALRLGR